MTGVEHITTGNNFINCSKIKTVIVNKAFNLDNQQFKKHNMTAEAQGIIYVDGTASESTFRFTAPNLNEFITGKVFYKGNATKCGQWNFDENGEIQSTSHNYVDGICSNCGKYSEEKTQGVAYGYDATENNGNGAYYVDMNTTLNLSVVEILGKYNDGIHGELPVTYVRNRAFDGNTNITRVILPESVTQLDGAAFANCSNLEFISMTGIVNMRFVGGLKRSYIEGTYDTTNNFLFCAKLKYVIVNKDFNLYYDTPEARQFYGSSAGEANVYVMGSEEDSTVKCGTAGNNNLLSGKVYYYSETQKTGCWYYDDNGNVAIWA
jgi:hypothetical protein